MNAASSNHAQCRPTPEWARSGSSRDRNATCDPFTSVSIKCSASQCLHHSTGINLSKVGIEIDTGMGTVGIVEGPERDLRPIHKREHQVFGIPVLTPLDRYQLK